MRQLDLNYDNFVANNKVNSNLMHQLFRDASDIDAGSPKAPSCPNGGWLNKITKGDLLAKVSSLFGC